MRRFFAGIVLTALAIGCATPPPVAPIAENPRKSEPIKVAVAVDPNEQEPDEAPQKGPWVGAAGLSDLVMAGTSETMLGVWVDVPAQAKQTVPSSAVALVIDTSGSMKGAKIENARTAAAALVDRLSNGDLISLYSFADQVDEKLDLTPLSDTSRPRFATAVSQLRPSGGTNLFEGVRSGERSVFAAPATHPVRRVVLISDGKANAGPTSPNTLGELAARGAEHGIQVTAVGVGLDYDESTLNALVLRSDGRLYHLTEPNELASILKQEMGLLQATAATDAYIDIVPAPGVEILAVDNARSTMVNGATRLPLGSLFAGQHREALIRVRVTANVDGSHPLASVRLHFRDPTDGNLDRVQEAVARYEVTRDQGQIALKQNARTREIVAVVEAGRLANVAAQNAAKGDVDQAAKDLAKAEAKLLAEAKAAEKEADKKRLAARAASVSKARKATEAAAAAPAAARPKAARAASLEANRADVDLAR